ncbi:MAG: hypothetical protein IJQ67_01755 [Bacilli bacterium]|nr:hypothetical protein [Bacilli bacterium]
MKKEQIKVGQKVKAIFRKYGSHIVIGEAFEISTDEHALKGTWVSIKVTGGNMNDPHVIWMVSNKVSCLIPIKDVVEILL